MKFILEHGSIRISRACYEGKSWAAFQIEVFGVETNVMIVIEWDKTHKSLSQLHV